MRLTIFCLLFVVSAVFAQQFDYQQRVNHRLEREAAEDAKKGDDHEVKTIEQINTKITFAKSQRDERDSAKSEARAKAGQEGSSAQAQGTSGDHQGNADQKREKRDHHRGEYGSSRHGGGGYGNDRRHHKREADPEPDHHGEHRGGSYGRHDGNGGDRHHKREAEPDQVQAKVASGKDGQSASGSASAVATGDSSVNREKREPRDRYGDHGYGGDRGHGGHREDHGRGYRGDHDGRRHN